MPNTELPAIEKNKKLELRPFQQRAVEKMVHFLKNNSEKGLYNASQMGLGKSAETIETIKRMSLFKVLIVCPAVMRHTWANEFDKWAETYCLKTKYKTAVIEKVSELATWASLVLPYAVIVSYELAYKCAAKLTELFDFECLVLDEAVYVKNPKAKRTKAILNTLWPKIPYRICLSGTPFTRSIADGYTLFHRLAPTAFPDFRTFTDRYTTARWNGFATVYEGIKNEKELSKIIRDSFYLRDTKADVAPELPPKNWCRISLPNSLSIQHDETEEEKKQHEFYIRLLRKSIVENRPAPIPPKPIATKRRLQALKKCESVAAFTKDLLEQNLPVVVFAYHKAVIAQLESSLVKFGPVCITGDTPPAQREANIRAFQEGKTNLIICNFQAGGIGITLTKSSNAVFAELDYSPAVISQACARLHRIGATLPINLYYFMVDASLEDGIFDVLIEKSETFYKVVENG